MMDRESRRYAVSPGLTVTGDSVEAAGKIAVGALKIGVIAAIGVSIWWVYGSMTGTGVPGALNKLVALPMKLTQNFINTANSALNQIFAELYSTFAQVRSTVSAFGYTSRRGVNAAWSSDTGYVPGRDGALLPRVASIFRKQAAYDVTKGKLFPWAFMMYQNGNFAVVPQGTRGIFPPWYKQPWFSKENKHANAVAVAMVGYQEGAYSAGAANAAFLLGRACGQNGSLADYVQRQIDAGRTVSLLQASMRPHSGAFEEGFNTAGEALEV